MKFDAGAYDMNVAYLLVWNKSCGSHPPKIFHLEQKCKENITSRKNLKVQSKIMVKLKIIGDMILPNNY